MDFLFLFFLLGVIGLYALSVYNAIIRDHNRVQRAWSDVLAYERQKGKILDAIEAQAGSFKEYEAKLLQNITGLRTAIDQLPREADGQKLSQVKAGTEKLMGGLRAVFEAYPELGATSVVNNLLKQIARQEEEVGAAVTIFNRAVEHFNSRIQQFPASLVNGALNKKTVIAPFSDSQASASFEFQPKF